METTEHLVYLNDLKPGMTFWNEQFNERWKLVRCPATGEVVKGVPGALLNDRRNKWFVEPVSTGRDTSLWLTRFDEIMRQSELQWEEPQRNGDD